MTMLTIECLLCRSQMLAEFDEMFSNHMAVQHRAFSNHQLLFHLSRLDRAGLTKTGEAVHQILADDDQAEAEVEPEPERTPEIQCDVDEVAVDSKMIVPEVLETEVSDNNSIEKEIYEAENNKSIGKKDRGT